MPNPFEGRRAQPQDASRPIVRTARSYTEDVRDAYNATKTRQDVEWYISPTGELKIGFTRAATERDNRIAKARDETERAKHLRNHLNGYQKDDTDGE